MGAEAFDDGAPDWCGHGGLDAHHAVGIDAIGIAAAKSLRMLDGAAHANGAYELVHRFGKWPAQEAHTRGVAKRRNTAAGTDDNAATPRQVTKTAGPVQPHGGFVCPFGVLGSSKNDDIDACFRDSKAIEYLLDSDHRLIIKCIINTEHDTIGNAVGIIRLQVDRAGERGAGKLCIGGDGILQVPEQKLKIRAIGNADIRNGLQRFWYIAACGRFHAASFPVGFRLGYTVWRRLAALS